MAKAKTALPIILNFLFIIPAYGSPVEIKGALSPLLWASALGVMIYCVKANKKFLRACLVS